MSIAAVSTELGLTKQALLHHFGSKEKLYAEVLKRISARLSTLAAPTDSDIADPQQVLTDYLIRIAKNAREEPHQMSLLMRELLDNQERADIVQSWFLGSFLKQLIQMLKASTIGQMLLIMLPSQRSCSFLGQSTITPYQDQPSRESSGMMSTRHWMTSSMTNSNNLLRRQFPQETPNHLHGKRGCFRSHFYFCRDESMV